MNVEVEGANRPVFCDAKRDNGRNGVTKNRTYIHLAIGRRADEEDKPPLNAGSKPLNFGCGKGAATAGPQNESGVDSDTPRPAASRFSNELAISG